MYRFRFWPDASDHFVPKNITPTCIQHYKWQRGFDGKFVKYIDRTGIYVLTFALAKLITFADFNYASMYPAYVFAGQQSTHAVFDSYENIRNS